MLLFFLECARWCPWRTSDAMAFSGLASGPKVSAVAFQRFREQEQLCDSEMHMLAGQDMGFSCCFNECSSELYGLANGKNGTFRSCSWVVTSRTVSPGWSSCLTLIEAGFKHDFLHVLEITHSWVALSHSLPGNILQGLAPWLAKEGMVALSTSCPGHLCAPKLAFLLPVIVCLILPIASISSLCPEQGCPCSSGIQDFTLEVGSSPPVLLGFTTGQEATCYWNQTVLNEIQYLLEIVSHVCLKCSYYIVFIFLCVLKECLVSVLCIRAE